MAAENIFYVLQPRLQNSFYISAAAAAESIFHFCSQWLQIFKTAAESITAAEKPPTSIRGCPLRGHLNDCSSKINFAFNYFIYYLLYKDSFKVNSYITIIRFISNGNSIVVEWLCNIPVITIHLTIA